MVRLDWLGLGKSVWACIPASAVCGFIIPFMFWLWDAVFPQPRCCEAAEISPILAYLEAGTLSLLSLFVIGLPAQALLHKSERTSLPSHMIVAIGLVTLVFCILLVPMEGFVNPLALLELYVVIIATTVIASTVFWLVRRPDLDDKPVK